MSKDSFYFSHDAGARNDERMLEIRSEFGWEGYGWYFAICELFRESSDYTLSKNVALLKLSLSVAIPTFEAFIEMCFNNGLFNVCETNDDRFFSESFMKRMEMIDEKHRKAAENGRKGGLARAAKFKQKSKSVSSGAIALLKQLKKIKLNEIKENEIILSELFTEFENKYPKKIIEEFFNHWTETNKKGRAKWKMEKTWETPKRLARWYDNHIKFNPKQDEPKTAADLSAQAKRFLTPEGNK